MTISKKNLVVVVVIVLAVLAVGFWKYKETKNNAYSVVHMATGEVYVGKLKVFPKFTLTDAYIFKVTKDNVDPNKNNFQLQPVKDTLWAPKQMYLVKDNVVFYGPLLSTSKIAETLAGQEK